MIQKSEKTGLRRRDFVPPRNDVPSDALFQYYTLRPLMIRLYVDTPLTAHQHILLNEHQSHYLQKVMRLKLTDIILLFNGKDGEWQAKITAMDKRTTGLVCLSQERPQLNEGNLCLLFSPLKPKRQEFLIEKAAELGVSCLWPIRCERTIIPKVNREKMFSQAREAAEQCGRLTVPEIKEITPLTQLFKNWPQDEMLIFGDESLTSPSIVTITDKVHGFFVGPEGGFTPSEQALLKTYAEGVTLNPHILRAETAALVGISYLKLIKG